MCVFVCEGVTDGESEGERNVERELDGKPTLVSLLISSRCMHPVIEITLCVEDTAPQRSPFGRVTAEMLRRVLHGFMCQ